MRYTTISNDLILGEFRGLEQCIVIGDEFVRRTAKIHLLKQEDAYATTRLETNVAAGDIFKSNNPHMISRIQNSLIQSLNKAIHAPKLIFLILEADLATMLQDRQRGHDNAEYYEEYLESMVDNFIAATNRFNNMLPKHAKREGWPKIVLLLPTMHRLYKDRELRQDFAASMLKVSKRYDNRVMTVKLRQIWNENDLSLCTDGQLNRDGISCFWRAFDRTVIFCDKKVTKEDLMANKTDGDNNSQNAMGNSYNNYTTYKRAEEKHGLLQQILLAAELTCFNFLGEYTRTITLTQ